MRSNLMQSRKLPNADMCPRLPPEIWDIIFKMKKNIENYEKILNTYQLYQRRLDEGWKPLHQGNWIYQSQKKKWNQMYFIEKILWQFNFIEVPKLTYVDRNIFDIFNNNVI